MTTQLKQDQALILELKPTDLSVKSQVIQIAWDTITYDREHSTTYAVLNKNYHSGGHSLLVRPNRRIAPEIMAEVNIDDFELLDPLVKPFHEAIPRFMERVTCQYIITHNAKRTKQLLKNSGVSTIDIEQFKFICLESLARQHYKLGNYSIPTLFCCAARPTAARELGNYRTGRYDPMYMRIIMANLAGMLSLFDFETAYKKSIDPSFDSFKAQKEHYERQANKPDTDYGAIMDALIARGDKAITCFVSNESQSDALGLSKTKAVIVGGSSKDGFISDDGKRFKLAFAYYGDFDLYQMEDVLDVAA